MFSNRAIYHYNIPNYFLFPLIHIPTVLIFIFSTALISNEQNVLEINS